MNSLALETLDNRKAASLKPYISNTRGMKKEDNLKRYENFRTACYRTTFESACRYANLSGVSPHVLRHKLASRLTMADAALTSNDVGR